MRGFASLIAVMTHNVFKTYHPVVAFVFLACAIALSMACLHPVFVMISLAGALACSAVTRGAHATALSLRWIVPLVVIVMIANPLFSPLGLTELFQLGDFRTIYLESVVYGVCAGGMLAAVFLWFASYAACMTSENSMALFGNVMPVVTLMVSQVMRLVPQFVSRGRTIAAAQDSVSAAAPRTKREAAAGRLRVANVLAGWGMEDGLVRGDAMCARGYGCGERRTTYQRVRFGVADLRACIFVGALAAFSAVGAIAVLSQFQFYPIISKLAFSWGYVAYALLMLFPMMLRAKEWLRWRSSR